MFLTLVIMNDLVFCTMINNQM